MMLVRQGLDFLRDGHREYMSALGKKVKIDVEELIMFSEKEEAIEVVGTCDCENKLEGYVYYIIGLDEDNRFFVRDISVISHGEVAILEQFPEEGNGVPTNSEYIEALGKMLERAKAYGQRNGGYLINVYAAESEDGVPMLLLAKPENIHSVRDGEYRRKFSDIREIAQHKEYTPYTYYDTANLIGVGYTYLSKVKTKYTVTYQKYKDVERTETIEGEFGSYRECFLYVEKLLREMEEHSLRVKSYEKFGMDIDRMDTLAGYFAMEYYMGYDPRFETDKEVVSKYKEREETFYAALHRQENLTEYCNALKSFLRYLPIEQIVTAYENLKKNPTGDILEIFHSACPSRYRIKYEEGISKEYPEMLKSRIYYTTELTDKSHIYKDNQIYLACVFDGHWTENPDGTATGYVVLLSEAAQFSLGREILGRKELTGPRTHEVEIKEMDQIHKKVMAVLDGLESEKTFPGTVLEDITYYSSQDDKLYAHAWAGDLVPVQISKRGPNGILSVKYCNPKTHSMVGLLKERLN